MCVLWYFADYFLELSHGSFSKCKGHILENLCVPFEKIYLFFFKKGTFKKAPDPWTLYLSKMDPVHTIKLIT